MRILVTGVAGFIGYHLVKRILEDDGDVIGIDNINNYYNQDLKLDRLKQLGLQNVDLSDSGDSFEIYKVSERFTFFKGDLENENLWKNISDSFEIDIVIHLAAQAGVRYSLKNPKAYIASNVEGFLNVLEYCRIKGVKKLIYASSSSVYGLGSKQPFSENENCDKPISLYAATKRANELMAFSYHHLFGINSIGLRFFTVYGPWGRPDMAPFLFTKAAFDKTKISVYNMGNQKRDFTYIDDIIDGVLSVINNFKIINGAIVSNIGQGNPVDLLGFIDEIEIKTNVQLKKEFMEAQPGDVEVTYADTTFLENNFNYKPKTGLKYGIGKFVDWYKDYYL